MRPADLEKLDRPVLPIPDDATPLQILDMAFGLKIREIGYRAVRAYMYARLFRNWVVMLVLVGLVKLGRLVRPRRSA